VILIESPLGLPSSGMAVSRKLIYHHYEISINVTTKLVVFIFTVAMHLSIIVGLEWMNLLYS